MLSLLLDTHILLWTAFDSANLPMPARKHLTDPANTPYSSVASIWEVAIKLYRNKTDFVIHPHVLRQTLIDNNLPELPVRSEHTLATLTLPPIHKDRFDRILIAHAIAENIQLLTADSTIAHYPGPILQV